MASWGGGQRDRRVRIGIAAVSGLVAVGAVVWVTVQWRQGQGPADAASLIGLVIAAVGAGISVEGLRVAHAALGQPADAAAQARSAAVTLAKQVEKAEADQWRRLVGGDRDRINVRYTLCPQNYPGAATPGPGGLLFAEENAPGVPDIAFYYRATTPARLVVTGAPGAGKTVLALELLLALIEHRDETDPVPVRISLSGWNTDTSLAGYVINHLVQAYDVSRSRATQLVDHDLVLPVLDGLDEMDPGMANADGAPLLDSDGRPLPDPAAPRARAALQALNDYSRGRTAGPVVLTCRTSHYEALADDDQLADAAQIRIEPVPVDAAMTYLAQRRGHDRRWQRLLEYLRAEPTGVLAQSLSTPWRLSLAATVYRREGEPIHLTTFATAADLDDHLLARLIPAVMTLYPPRQAYSHQSVHVWLARIAHHLQQPAHAPPGPPAVGAGPRTDVHLHQLWSLAGQSLVRIADAVLAIVYVLASAGLLLAQTPLDLSARACLGAAGFAVVAVLAVLRAGSPHVAPPMVVHLRHPSTPRGKRRLARMLMAALVGGLAGGTSIGLAAGAAYGLAAGLAYAFAAALAAALSRQADSPGEDEPHAANPSRLVWQDLTIGLVTGLVAGLATGLTTGLTYGIAGGLAGGITAGLSGGLAFGLAAGLVYGLAAGLATGLATSLVTGLSTGLTLGLAGGLVGGVYLFTGAGRRYLVFLCCARSRGMLPFRTGSFLNWAYKAGLLRLSGSAYQFRHRELQQWLTTHSSPGTGL